MFFKVLTMMELTNTSKVLHSFMEFKLLLGSKLSLGIRRVSFFDISMLFSALYFALFDGTQ